MLAPVFIKGKSPVVLALNELIADNIFDAIKCAEVAGLRTGWHFTHSFVNINEVKGVHAVFDGMDIALLADEYAYERSKG